MRRFLGIALSIFACSLPAVARSETLEEYAAKCDAATGTTVPDFVCSEGTPVPATSGGVPIDPRTFNGVCDRPNVLNRECDPGSHFRVLSNDSNGYVVAHCRKRGNTGDNYGDIAVIQHSKVNGATCFYQALGVLPGRVKAPSKGTSAYPWKTPAQTAAIDCGGCHDNGPLVRSPYLTQIRGRDTLPGAGNPNFNRNEPYSFVGEDFAHWRTYKVEIAGNTCNGCHRMGVNNIAAGLGTSLDLGIRATAPSQTAKNPHSATSPIWMLPGQTLFSQATADAAAAIRACALQFNATGPLPNTNACRISLLAGPYVPPVVGERLAGIWEKPTSVTWQARYGLTTSAFQAEFDRLVGQGFRLTRVDGYESGGTARYAAIFDKVASAPWVARVGLTGAEFQSVFSSLVGQGFRLVWINGYTVGGKDLYEGIWEQSAGPAFEARFGLTQEQLQTEFVRLVGLGFRMTVVGGYSVAGSPRFVAIWEKRAGPAWQARVGLDKNAFQAEFNRLFGLGFRLVQLSGYRVGTQTLFGGLWEQDASKAFITRSDLTGPEFQAEFDRIVAQGFRLSDITAY